MPPSQRRDQIMQALNNTQLGRGHPNIGEISAENDRDQTILNAQSIYFAYLVLEVILKLCSSSILARPFCRPEAKGSRLEMIRWGPGAVGCRGPGPFLLSFLAFGTLFSVVG